MVHHLRTQTGTDPTKTTPLLRSASPGYRHKVGALIQFHLHKPIQTTRRNESLIEDLYR